jgi:hypothetical protein
MNQTVFVRLRGIVAGVLLASTVAAPVLAAPKLEPGAPAYVSLTRLLGEYRKTSAFAKQQAKMTEQAKLFREELQSLAQLRYCSDVERKEALAIKANSAADMKQKARLAELMKKADTVENELASLSQKPKPTEVEVKRIQELSQMRTEADPGAFADAYGGDPLAGERGSGPARSTPQDGD